MKEPHLPSICQKFRLKSLNIKTRFLSVFFLCKFYNNKPIFCNEIASQLSHLCHVESEENSSEKLFILFYNIFTKKKKKKD